MKIFKMPVINFLLYFNILLIIIFVFLINLDYRGFLLGALIFNFSILIYRKYKIISIGMMVLLLIFNFYKIQPYEMISEYGINEKLKATTINNQYNAKTKLYDFKNDLEDIRNIYYYIQNKDKDNMNGEFYYQLCLFYEDNKCNPYLDHFYEDNLNNKIIQNRLKYQNNNIQPFYNKEIFLPKEHLDYLLYNYPFFKQSNLKLINNNKLECVFLFYGTQNGWNDYNIKLINKLNEDEMCINIILQSMNINTSYSNEYKKKLLDFLKSQ